MGFFKMHKFYITASNKISGIGVEIAL